MPELIDTSRIPDTGLDPDAVDTAGANLRRIGREVAVQGAAVLASWRPIAACYEAPEDETLFAVLDPVGTETAEFGADWAAAAAALEACAEEIRPIKAALVGVRVEADAFVREVAGGVLDPFEVAKGMTERSRIPWWQDPVSVARNNAFLDRVNAEVVKLWAAHRTCANAIFALTGSAFASPAGGGNPGGYGVPGIPRGTSMPWGAHQRRPESCGAAVLRGFFWDGLAVGMLGGTAQGVGGLVGLDLPSRDRATWNHSWGTAAATWAQIGLVAAAIANPAKPWDAGKPRRVEDVAFWDSFVGTGRALVNLDMWRRRDYAGAAGATVFNVATFGAGAWVKLPKIIGAGPDPRIDRAATVAPGSLDAASTAARAQAASDAATGVRMSLSIQELTKIDLTHTVDIDREKVLIPAIDNEKVGLGHQNQVRADSSSNPEGDQGSQSGAEIRDSGDGLHQSNGSSSENASDGTPTIGRGAGAGPAHLATNPSNTYDPSRRPSGPATIWGDGATEEVARSYQQENRAAQILAQEGFEVEQNPTTRPNGKNPDYRIEGEYFDAYSPSTNSLDNLLKEISGKIKRDQAHRIVLNTDDTGVGIRQIVRKLEAGRILGLEEIIFIGNGQIFQWTRP